MFLPHLEKKFIFNYYFTIVFLFLKQNYVFQSEEQIAYSDL
jgi:hypothetical protein